LAVATLWLLAVAVSAAEPLPATKSEVAAILDHLGSSQCRFFRNGSWHSGAETRDHLRMKYKYLVEQGLVATTADFIAGAGSKSSAGGVSMRFRVLTVTPSQAPFGLRTSSAASGSSGANHYLIQRQRARRQNNS